MKLIHSFTIAMTLASPSFACAMFDDTFDYYEQLGLEINVEQKEIFSAYKNKNKAYWQLQLDKSIKGLRNQLAAYDAHNGTHWRNYYDNNSKAFKALNNPDQRKAYDTYKRYDLPEPTVPNYHNNVWCTGYCKKYNHKIHIIDKEKLVGQCMPLACGHKLCVLCAQFDPENTYDTGCPFKIAVPNCGCQCCPLKLEQHLVFDHKITCPNESCGLPIVNAAHMRQQLMQDMTYQEYCYSLLPPEMRPFANRWHFGFMLTSLVTLKFVSHWAQEVTLNNRFNALEKAADDAVWALTNLEFEQGDNVVLGLRDRFDIEKLIVSIPSEELQMRLTEKLTTFDTTLVAAYGTVCSRYYYSTPENFQMKEAALVNRLNASLAELKQVIDEACVVLKMRKTMLSPRLKLFAGACVGGLLSLLLLSNAPSK